jgi:hypothetical protein
MRIDETSVRLPLRHTTCCRSSRTTVLQRLSNIVKLQNAIRAYHQAIAKCVILASRHGAQHGVQRREQHGECAFDEQHVLRQHDRRRAASQLRLLHCAIRRTPRTTTTQCKTIKQRPKSPQVAQQVPTCLRARLA